jgi:hypothetical protein
MLVSLVGELLLLLDGAPGSTAGSNQPRSWEAALLRGSGGCRARRVGGESSERRRPAAVAVARRCWPRCCRAVLQLPVRHSWVSWHNCGREAAVCLRLWMARGGRRLRREAIDE